MFRIDDNQNVATLPAPPTDNVGTPGYFTGGNPGASPPVPPTRVRFWWLNLVQESLMALLSATGLAPSKTDSTLVLQAVSMIGKRLLTISASQNWTVPPGVYRVDALVIGGGGPGGFNANWASGGGGSGGKAIKEIAVTPGQVIAATVGAGGVVSATAGAAGTPGGATSFGPYVSATGGGAGAGNASGSNAGGPPGMGVGGDYNDSGAYGGDSIPLGQRGGDGGGPGNGRGTTGYATGISATGYGGGGGGGGSSAVNGGGAGASGGNGAPGVIILRY